MDMFQFIWVIGIMFSVGYIKFIGTEATIASVGWKGFVLILLTNLCLLIMIVFLWPYLLGVELANDLKRKQ
jgi:hypothetical protein